MHHHSQLFAHDVADLTLGVWCLKRPIIIIKEDLAPCCLHYHGARWETFDLHNALHLLLFILSSEEGKPDEQLI